MTTSDPRRRGPMKSCSLGPAGVHPSAALQVADVPTCETPRFAWGWSEFVRWKSGIFLGIHIFLILCGSMKIKNIPRSSYNFVTICYNLLNYDIQFVIHIYYWDNDITNWDNDVTGCLGMVKYGFSVYACYLVKDVVCAYIYIYIYIYIKYIYIYIYTIDRVLMYTRIGW